MSADRNEGSSINSHDHSKTGHVAGPTCYCFVKLLKLDFNPSESHSPSDPSREKYTQRGFAASWGERVGVIWRF